jgi:hypothetical protein
MYSCNNFDIFSRSFFISHKFTPVHIVQVNLYFKLVYLTLVM